MPISVFLSSLNIVYATCYLSNRYPVEAYKIQRNQLTGSMRDVCDFWAMKNMTVEVVADCLEIKCFCCKACCDDDGCGTADGTCKNIFCRLTSVFQGRSQMIVVDSDLRTIVLFICNSVGNGNKIPKEEGSGGPGSKPPPGSDGPAGSGSPPGSDGPPGSGSPPGNEPRPRSGTPPGGNDAATDSGTPSGGNDGPPGSS